MNRPRTTSRTQTRDDADRPGRSVGGPRVGGAPGSGPGQTRARGPRWLLLGAGSVALLLVVLVTLHTAPVRRLVLTQVIAFLAGEEIGLEAEALRYNLADLSVVLEDARVRTLSRTEVPVFATVGYLQVDLSLLDLLRGRYVIESVVVEEARVHYQIDSNGRSNLPVPVAREDVDPDPEGTRSDPLAYLVDEGHIRGAEVHYEDRSAGIDLILPGLEITVDGRPPTGRHEIGLVTSEGTARYDARELTLRRIEGQLDLGPDDLSIGRLAIDVTGAQVAVTGDVRHWNAVPALDLTATAQLDATALAEVADLDEEHRVAGNLDATVALTGRLSELVVDATVEGEGVTARGLAPATLLLAAQYDQGAEVADVRDLRLTSPWGVVAGEGTVALTELDPSSVTLTIDGLRVAGLTQALDLPYGVAARVDATVDGSWQGLDYATADGRVELVLRPTETPAPSANIVPVTGRVEATAADGRIVATLDTLQALSTTADGRVVLAPQGELDGTVRGRVADLDELIQGIEALLGRPAGDLLPVALDGAVQLDAVLGGSMSAPAVAADLVAPALVVGAVQPIRVTAHARYTPEALRLQAVDVAWEGARLRASGRLGLDGRQPVELAFAAESVPVASLLNAAEIPDAPVSGRIDVTGDVAGTASAPTARVELVMSEVVAYRERLGTVTATVDLADRRLDVERLVLDKPQDEGTSRLALTGTYDLEQETFVFDLESDDLRLEQLTLPGGSPVRGAVELAAEGTGTIEDPTVTARLVTDALRVGAIEVGAVTVDAHVADGEATVDATSERYGAALTAAVGIESPYPATADLRVTDLSLDTLPISPDTPITGDISARLDAQGDLATPTEGTAALTVDALSARWNEQPVELDQPAVVRYADERMTVEALRLSAHDSTIAIDGGLPLQAGERGELHSRGRLEVETYLDLATLTRYAPLQDPPLEAEGSLRLGGAIGGALTALEPDLTLTADRVRLLGVGAPITIDELQATVRDGLVTLDALAAAWGDATIEASGRLPLSVVGDTPLEVPPDRGPATLSATVDGLDPAMLPGAPEGLSGEIGLSVEAAAPEADLASLDARATFDDLRVSFDALDLAQRQPSRLTVSNGEVIVEQMHLQGDAGYLEASGSIGLTGDQALDVTARGALEVAAISVVTDAVRAEGRSTAELTARGTLADPALGGFFELTDGSFLVETPRIGADAVEVRFELDGRRVVLATLDGNLNGGTMDGSGYLELGEGLVSAVDLQLSTEDFAFDAPLDLRSLSNSTFQITSRDDGVLAIEGAIRVEEAGLTGDINFDSVILTAAAAPSRLDLTGERSSLLERVRLDVAVDTDLPIVVDNNIARAEATTDLRVVGTPYETGLTGRLELLEEGEIRVNERRYEIERAVIIFTDETQITPSFDLLLHTTAGAYDITLAITGPPGETETSLTSDPTLPEPDIMALLVTGRTLDEMRGEEYDVAREQILSALAGGLTSRLSRGLERATGLSDVRLEPNLIAGEEDPSARLTLGQDLTDRLSLIFSNDLVDTNDQIWITEYDVTRRFGTRAVRQPDNSYRFDFQHDVRVGGSPAPRRRPRTRPTVEMIAVTADTGPGDAELQEMLDVEIGDDYDYLSLLSRVEAIEEHYREQGRLQARVRLQREIEGPHVDLILSVVGGPEVELRFDGLAPPSSVREELARQWSRGVFDTQRIDDCREVIRAWLMGDRFLDPTIEISVQEAGPDLRQVVFRIDAGRRFESTRPIFAGASGVDPSVLRDIVEEQGLTDQTFTDPLVVTELLELYYREQGYLVASIEEPEYDFESPDARVTFRVDEGPRFVISAVTVSGNEALSTEAVLDEVPLRVGDPYLPAVAERSVRRLRSRYWQDGYVDARITPQIDGNPETGELEVTLAVDEGVQTVVADVVVTGIDETSRRLIRDQVELTTGAPLDLTAFGRSRRNLYDTGAFSVVDITRVEASPVDATPTESDAAAELDGTRPVEVTVAVREVQPIQIRYGASFDTERGPGGRFEISNHNSLGQARVLGLSTRYDSQLRSARVHLSQPALRGWPVETTLAAYLREERRPFTDLSRNFDVDRRGVSVQQERQLGDDDEYVWTYGYRFERVRTQQPGGVLSPASNVSPLTTTLTRETRDDVLDASTGAFLSQSFSYSPAWLGADAPFVKYFGQYFHYRPLREPTRERFTHELIRPRLVFAAGARLGVATGIGGDLPLSERFFAGGSNTVRGFVQDGVGPRAADGRPLGGETLLVLNAELRFPLISLLDGVTFLDVGTVTPGLADFSLTDLRESAGVGVRLRTPWFLIRGDYGVLLDRRDGERRARFYFSIGQAF